MSRKVRPSLADLMAAAAGPALIIGLVVSLLYFLLEVLYAGRYETRLQWVFFCFILAAVMIARLTMEGSRGELAGVYGIVLALAVFAALQGLVEYPPGMPLTQFRWLINAGLMGLVWWCAHRLTWDCTYVDERADASGAGLLEAAGLSGIPVPATPYAAATKEATGGETTERSSPLAGWWQHYREYREARRRQPHALGVWVVYFSLAALPIFGLGQALIPPEELERRRYAFWLLAAYVACALGLLLITCFLSLRRYLRQRRLRMPAAMAGMWIVIGAAMIAALLSLGVLLPRPNAEYALFPLRPLGGATQTQNDREPSRFAPLDDDPSHKKDPGAAGKPEREGEGDPDRQARGQNGEKDSEQAGQGKANEPKQGSGGDQAAQRGQRGEKSSRGGRDGQGSERRRRGGDRKSQTPNSRGGGQEAQDRQSAGDARSWTQRVFPPRMARALALLAGFLKLIFFGLIGAVVAALAIWAALRFLANFTEWARRLIEALRSLWDGLFGWSWESHAPSEPVPPIVRPRRPFAAFANPFESGAAGSWSAAELVRYSFEALEAWGRGRALGRQSGETPIEYGFRLGQESPELDSAVRRLVGLYARMLYAPGPLPPGTDQTVREFWVSLQAMPTCETVTALS